MNLKHTKKKALLVTTVSGFVPQFEMDNVRLLQELGYEVHYAANFYNVSYGLDNHRLDGTGIIRHQVDFVRSPFWPRANYKAYRQLKQVMQEDSFDLVHCHTPMGAVLARLVAGTYRKQGCRVLYTAHGFHFYKGAPLKYWLLFYPVERWLAGCTDVLITINEEDYERARRFCRRKKTQVEHIPGVGVDTAYWSGRELPAGEREQIRKRVRDSLSAGEEETVFLSVGELIPRKNHRMVIQTLAGLKKERKDRDIPVQADMPSFHYVICGHGVLQEELHQMIEETGLSGKVTLLGYCEDIRDLLYAADVFVFPSLQEGMPVALMEAIAAGLPVIASDIRGNRELVRMQENAQLFSDAEGLKQLLQEAMARGGKVRQAEEKAENTAIGLQEIDRYQVSRQMKKIYEEIER